MSIDKIGKLATAKLKLCRHNHLRNDRRKVNNVSPYGRIPPEISNWDYCIPIRTQARMAKTRRRFSFVDLSSGLDKYRSQLTLLTWNIFIDTNVKLNVFLSDSFCLYIWDFSNHKYDILILPSYGGAFSADLNEK